jgi:hypothetical protein
MPLPIDSEADQPAKPTWATGPSLTGAPVPDVAVLVWPHEAHEVDRLRTRGVPRLLLVPSGSAPPHDVDHLTEWVRVPASAHEVAARVVALVRRAGSLTGRPHVDEHGRITYGDRWAALSPIESRIAGVLSERFCQIVGAEQLRASGWPPAHPEGPTTATALRVHLHRLRHRVADLGLEVVTVRNEGVVLQPVAAAGPRAAGR